MPDQYEPKIYPCPLPDCLFAMVSEPPSPAENDTTLADVFGFGVFGAVATARRLERMEQQLRAHLDTHNVPEFAIALANANKRIRELQLAALESPAAERGQ